MTTVSGSTCAVTAVSKSPTTIQLKSIAVNDPPDATVEKSEQDATNERASADTATQCARRPMTPPKNMLRSAPTRGKAGISQTVDDTGSCYGAVTAGVKVGTALPASAARRVHDHREQRQRNKHELSPHDAIAFAGRRRPAWYYPHRAPAVSRESLGALRPVPAPRRGRLGRVSRLASDGSRSQGRVDAAALPRPEDAVHALPRGPARQRDAGRGPGRAIGHADDGRQAGGPPRPARGDSPRGADRRG